ncbi:hypothetical protein DTO027B5_5297 [Paecilomyces variotii]|nr:hypothetical protein DTO217A2_2056 [Paecilomyces variotii]KAJ9320846.1 hypothetical protein DTO027B3_8158 [Paecilomyces variotii]KAJ9332870.1 hypothetical protein DTO027B5_5297 [Paecilomyces variotii]KAJ9369866.1 hypothetical protein DTO282E5_5374 [Paecilomyces variotii]
MSTSLGIEQKYALVTRRLEVQTETTVQQLHAVLSRREVVKYQWITAPTGKPHIGYLIPLLKFADFIRAGGEVIVELTDTYAFLVNYKIPWEQVLHRTAYYQALITAALKVVGIPLSKVQIVQASTYQGTYSFSVDFWKLCALSSLHDVRRTGAEVGSSTMLSPLLTPILQELAEVHSAVDVQLGGKDQRGIFEFGEEFLPRLGYPKRAHVLNEMLPGLTGDKMSSSYAAHTKIMFLDDANTIQEKIAGAACPIGVVEGNAILPIVQHILMPLRELHLADFPQAHSGELDTADEVSGHREGGQAPINGLDVQPGTLFSVSVRRDGDGGCEEHQHYRSYEDLEQDYRAHRIPPDSLKAAVASGLIEVLEPLRQIYESSPEWRESDLRGYPEDWPVPAATVEQA